MVKQIDLKSMTTEELQELSIKIGLELESRQPRKVELVVYTHDCKSSAEYHKNKYKHWSKLITSIDTTKTNGYAFGGEFLNINAEHKVLVGSIMVEVCNVTITAYRMTADGKEKISEAKTNSMSDFIEELATMVNKQSGEL